MNATWTFLVQIYKVTGEHWLFFIILEKKSHLRKHYDLHRSLLPKFLLSLNVNDEIIRLTTVCTKTTICLPQKCQTTRFWFVYYKVTCHSKILCLRNHISPPTPVRVFWIFLFSVFFFILWHYKIPLSFEVCMFSNKCN